MEKALMKPSQKPCTDSPLTLDSLVREWVAKLAVNAGASLDAKTQAVFCSIWLDGLSDLSPAVLLAAFRKTLRECPYWPVKVADIRKHVTHAVSNATDEAADKAWNRVLEIRRVHWCPDIPAPFDRAVSQLTERVKQAARAAGVWRDFTESEWESGTLHTWAKKRFFESFNSWGEREQDKFLLPEGETKKLLIDVAETKALPWAKPKEAPQLPPEERLRVADELAAAARQVLASYKPPEPYQVENTAERREELERQKKIILAKHGEAGKEASQKTFSRIAAATDSYRKLQSEMRQPICCIPDSAFHEDAKP
jgi:hypothetical protein